VTGLDYAVNRFYSPLQGRFAQVDPIGMAAVSLGNPQSLNLYSYVQNDPISFVDPTGLQEIHKVVPSEPGGFTVTINEGGDSGESDRTGFFGSGSGMDSIAIELNPDNGGGGGSGGQDDLKESKPPNADQCAGIRELLRREQLIGTGAASLMSSVTFGVKKIDSLDNRKNGNLWVGGKEFDLDWFMDVKAFQHVVNVPNSFNNPAFSFVNDAVGKVTGGGTLTDRLMFIPYSVIKAGWGLLNAAVAKANGIPVENMITSPVPFTDPGEKNAMFHFAQKYHRYSDIFTPDWMKANCPPPPK
jgi:RHS repeat-associated protein